MAQRVWTTEIGVAEHTDGSVQFGTRLLCVTRGADIPFDRSIPRFVRDVVESGHAELDGRIASTLPWIVRTEEDVEDLVWLLKLPARRSDVIVFSLPEGSVDEGQTAADAWEVAVRTAGAAHVVIITSPASFGLSDRVGKEFSVFRQGVRTYRPGFNPALDEPFRHPLGLPHRIASWPYGGREGYEKLLISQALIRTVADRDLERGVPSFSAVRRAAAEIRRSDAIQSVTSEAELLALAEEEIDQLRRALDEEKTTNSGLLQVAEEERSEAIEAAEQARLANAHLRLRLTQLEAAAASDAILVEPQLPTNLLEFETWCFRNLSGQVEIHNRALQGVKKSQFEDTELVYKALLLLRDYYVPMRRDGGAQRRTVFEEECQRLGVVEEPTFSGSRAGEEGDTYFIRFAGRRALLDRHLKKGNSRDPRYCFRLYFFWDEESQQAVVGWLPSHLDTRLT